MRTSAAGPSVHSSGSQPTAPNSTPRYIAAAAGFTPRVAQEARELDTLIALVSAGLGVTLVPASAARFPRPGVMFLPLAGEALSFRLVALRRRGLAPPAVRSFLEVLYEVGGGD